MIPSEDYTKQERIYTQHGQGLWRIIGYFSGPSLTMQNILTKRREVFGIHSLNAEAFEPIPGLEAGDGESPVRAASKASEAGSVPDGGQAHTSPSNPKPVEIQ